MGPLLPSAGLRTWSLCLLVICIVSAPVLPAVHAQPTDPGSVLLSGLTGLLASPVYSTVVQAVLYANLTEPVATLADTTGITIFAPSNAGFQALGNGIITCLLNQPDVPLLTSILEYHVVKGVYNSTTLAAGAPLGVESVNGKALNFTTQGSSLFVNGVNISAPDAIQLPGSAVVHGLPTVLVPPGGLAAVVALCSSPANLTGGHPLPTNATPAAGTSSAVGATAAVPGGCSTVGLHRRSLFAVVLSAACLSQLL